MDAFRVDLRAHLERTVASLYSHLVTRPTGRAVRIAIEHQLGELATPALSLLDLSAVSVLDYSCADEVVAKLLLRYREEGREVFFLLRGVRDHHLDPIEAVLERHGLAIVAELDGGRFELLGSGADEERALWRWVEERRSILAPELSQLCLDLRLRERLDFLERGRLVFRDPMGGSLHALSGLIDSTRG